ncbi:MAG: hypothetical protein JNK79_06405 [Chitinophagaceae bacterium]|nr:hypothetical protein [Chitinophagaceae bacterium]
MALIGILLAAGTLVTLAYAGYILFRDRQFQTGSSPGMLPFLPKVATENKQIPADTDHVDLVFEAHIADKFDREEYRLVHWRRDRKSKKNVPHETFQPALSFQLADNSSIQFSIECQYAPGFTNTNAIEIFPDQVEKYYAYQQQNNRVVFVILGVGGSPEKPERIYVVPLNDIPRKQEYLPASYLSRYRKLDLKSNFFLLPERMLLI